MTTVGDNNGEPNVQPSLTGYQVGAFTLYLESQSLLLDEQYISLEPKVFDVLVYLCQHNDHFVSIQELHDNVWAGRIVSDAAVRRSVSKLRALLSQADGDEDYVKSVHKRGYALTCELTPIYESQPPLAKASEADPVVDSAQPHDRIPATAWLSQRALLLCVVVLLLLIVSWAASTFLLSERAVKSDMPVSQKVIDYPGEKAHVSVSRDGELIAFAGKVMSYQGFQLFVKRRSDPAVKQLTFDANNVVRVAFSANVEHIYFIDMNPGKSSLKRVVLGEEQPHTEVMLDDFFILSDMAVLPDESGAFISGMATQSDVGQTFYLDFTTRTIKALGTQLSEAAYDYKVALTQDGKRLATATTLSNTNEQWITVFDTENYKVVNRFYHDKRLFAIDWLKDSGLLILDEDGLSQIDTTTGAKQLVLQSSDAEYRSFNLGEQSNVYLLRHRKDSSLFIEVNSRTFDLAAQEIAYHSDSALEQVMYFGRVEVKLLIRKLAERSTLYVKNEAADTEEKLFETTLDLNVLDVNVTNNRILVSLDGMLAVFDSATNQLTYVDSDGQRSFFDGILSTKASGVLYGQKQQNGWRIMRYPFDSKTKTLILEGFKSVREYSQGFVLINDAGEFFLADNEFNAIRPLNHAVILDSKIRWFVRGDMLYWSFFDGKSIAIVSLNLISGEKNVTSLDGTQFSLQFDVSPDGKRAVLKSRTFVETEIIKTTLH